MKLWKNCEQMTKRRVICWGAQKCIARVQDRFWVRKERPGKWSSIANLLSNWPTCSNCVLDSAKCLSANFWINLLTNSSTRLKMRSAQEATPSPSISTFCCSPTSMALWRRLRGMRQNWRSLRKEVRSKNAKEMTDLSSGSKNLLKISKRRKHLGKCLRNGTMSKSNKSDHQ